MGLYLDNGYVNIRYCMGFRMPFTFIIGGRATGKTFSSQLTCIEDHLVYMLMRRTQAQADIISKPAFSPIKPVADYLHRSFVVDAATKYNGTITTDDDGERQLIGYTAALSTFSNLRGFSGEDIQVIIFDEFIPELHERALKHEDSAFFNVIETINRNRELNGSRPVQTLLLSNSNSLNSPILAALDLVKVVARMEDKGQQEYINPERGIAIFLLLDSMISERKRDTALYRATAGTDFAAMALDNEFAYDDLSDVKSLPLKGFKLKMQIGPYYIYQTDRFVYISSHSQGTPASVYEDTEIDKRRFVREHPGFLQKILKHKVRYESFQAKTYLTSLYF